MIDIYAGKTATKIINEQGLNPELFTSFLGASGGPKWFTLFGLDKYIFSEFFKNRTQPLNLIGSSAGAFRSACFAQKDPVAAIERLAKSYSQTRYSTNKPTPNEITIKARALLDEVFGDNGVTEILNNEVYKAHFIVAKSNGFIASENKLIQLLGLSKSYMLNRVNRKFLGLQYERFIFGAPNSNLSITDGYNVKTQNIALTQNNLKDALLASGSIPLVMQGIRNIAGSPKGMYRDGGIIDYHFDFKVNNPGLILYPTLVAIPKQGGLIKT
jgi:predicted acylesterase/phospholipase RssA